MLLLIREERKCEIMKKQVKRIITVCLMVMVALPVSNVFAAGNLKKWEWYSSVGGTSTVITPHKDKKNDSSSYINYEGGTTKYITVRVYGTQYRTDLSGQDDGANCTLACAENNYYSYYRVKSGTGRKLKNRVRERGYKNVYLKIGVGKDYLAGGYWKADTV